MRSRSLPRFDEEDQDAWLRCVALLDGKVCLLGLFGGAVRCHASLTPEMRADDARLEAPVMLREPRIRLGELIERLSQQSGVVLRLTERTPASGITPMACLNRVPRLRPLTPLPHCPAAGAIAGCGRERAAGAIRVFAAAPGTQRGHGGMEQQVQEAFEKQSEL